jgi:hypothetical protein
MKFVRRKIGFKKSRAVANFADSYARSNLATSQPIEYTDEAVGKLSKPDLVLSLPKVCRT